MYLEIFQADFAVFRVFWGISRDFAEIPEFRGSATARNIRSPVLLIKKVVSCCIKFIFVVKDWIVVISSEKGYRLQSMSVLRENIIYLTVKFSFRYCEV